MDNSTNSIVKLILLVLCLYSVSAYSQIETGTIRGVIKTHDGVPAPYVNVSIKEIKGKGVTSTADGSFTIRNIKEGSYTLVATFVGLKPEERLIEIKAGQTRTLTISLAENSQQLNEIIISDKKSLNEKSVGIGKASISPMDLPQSVITIGNDVLQRQQVLRVSDVLMNTSGIYLMGATGGYQEEIAGRGFSYGNSNTFKNGVRFNNGVMPEMSSIEQVEVLKGSNAILYGNVAAGGVINIVTKKPKFENGGEVSFRTGSYNFFKPSIDIYGAVDKNKRVAYRINTSYENAGSFRDNVNSERIYFNPSLLVKASNKTEIILEGDYLKDNRTLDYGTGAIAYVVADIPRNRFLGASWSYFKGEQKSATFKVTHTLNHNWELHGIASYQGFVNDAYGTTRPNGVLITGTQTGMLQSDGAWVRGLQRSGSGQDYYLGEVNLTGKFLTGRINHSLLSGVDVDKYDTENKTYTYRNAQSKNQNVYDTINIYDLTAYKQRNDIPEISRNQLTKNPIKRTGVFVQDLISLTQKLKLLAGLRYSYIESTTTTYTYAAGNQEPTTGTPSNYYDGAFSPRVGIVFQPAKEMSLYASYANSFSLNTAKDSLDNFLPPSLIDQYEVGVKNDLFNGVLSVNVTAYQIINANTPQPYYPVNPKKPNAQELAGEITSKGVEIDIASKPYKGFSFIAGYSYNDTRYTKSTQYINNSRLRYNPSNTANASVYYAIDHGVLKGFNAGIIAYYVGNRVAGRSTQITVVNDTRKLMPVPDYVQFDASAGYTFSAVSVRVKVSNLLNQLSYNVHDDNSVNPIAPRMLSTTLSIKL